MYNNADSVRNDLVKRCFEDMIEISQTDYIKCAATAIEGIAGGQKQMWLRLALRVCL